VYVVLRRKAQIRLDKESRRKHGMSMAGNKQDACPHSTPTRALLVIVM
jgi:hypothetical protein